MVRLVMWKQVGQCLLKAIKTVLGDAANEQIMSAWAVAYGVRGLS